MVELSVVRDLVAIFGVIAGFSYYVIVVNNTRKNQQLQLEIRQAQLFSQFMFQVFTTEFIKQYFDLFEMDWDDYDDYWKKYGLLSNPDERAHMYTPNYMEDFEYLYNEVVKYREKVGQKIDTRLGLKSNLNH